MFIQQRSRSVARAGGTSYRSRRGGSASGKAMKRRITSASTRKSRGGQD